MKNLQKLLKEQEEEFDKEFPPCNCENNEPPHFENQVNRTWIKNLIQSNNAKIIKAVCEEERDRIWAYIDEYLRDRFDADEEDLTNMANIIFDKPVK